MEYKPLNMFIAQTDELKKLIAEHPDYPIVVMCSNEVVSDDYYGWWYAPVLTFSIGQILDCELEDSDRVYTDRDEFQEDPEDRLYNSGKYDDLSDEEFMEIVNEFALEYEPYWKNVIQIKADV